MIVREHVERFWSAISAILFVSKLLISSVLLLVASCSEKGLSS
jgi:hypothetical protein